MEREMAFLTVGLILFVAGAFLMLAYLPTYTSLYFQVNGIEAGDEPLTKADYGFYLMLSVILMPLLVILSAIGGAFILLGLVSAFSRGK